MYVTSRRKRFLKHTTDGAINHSGGNERHLLGTDRVVVPTCKGFVRCVVVLSWLCIVCIKCMEPLSFDSPAENLEM